MRIRLTPKSSRDALEGIETLADGSAVLKARVRAVPEDGKANQALIALLAKRLGLPKRAISLQAGHTSRIKTVSIAGDARAIETALRAWL